MIRPATHSDVETLAELGAMFYGETILADIVPYDRISVEELLKSYIDSPDSCAVFVLEHNARVVGGIFGALVPLYWNVSATAAQQFGWFVHPDHRGGESISLLDIFEKWGADRGARMFFSGAKKNRRFRAMDRILTSRGYQEVESMHVKGGQQCPRYQ